MTLLEHDGPATQWLHALPLGNGRLGAMCWGGADGRFDLNHEGVWSGAPRGSRPAAVPDERARALVEEARRAALEDRGHDATAPLQALQEPWTQAYLPLGSLTLPGSGPSAGAGDDEARGRRSLDLRTGVHTWTTRGGRARTVVSAVDDVLLHVAEGADAAPGPLTLTSPLRELRRVASDDRLELWLRAPSDVAPGHEPDAPAAVWGERAVQACVVVARRRHRDGWVLALAVETTYDGPGRPLLAGAEAVAPRARERVDRVLAEDPEAVLARHVAEHVALAERCVVTFGPPAGATGATGAPAAPGGTVEERLTAARADARPVLDADPALAGVLLEHGRYLLQSSSRGCRLPATLQGIWNDDMRPPWSSNFTLNINTEMNLWSAEVLGLPETVQPLEDLVLALADTGRDEARRLGAEGWAAHHNSDAWAFSGSVGAGHGDPSWAFWPMGGLWLVRHLVERVRFGSVDDDHLRTVTWPVLRGAAEFALTWPLRGADGAWVSAPSTSPENTFLDDEGRTVSVATSSGLDRALVRDVLRAVVELAPRLGAGADGADDLVERARAVLAEVPAVLVDDAGRVVEWDRPRPEVDRHHRHVSHLFPLFPGDEVLTADERDAVTATLKHRRDDSSGWSLAWKIALWARLHRPDRVAALLELVFRDAAAVEGEFAGGLYRNLFAAHPPFQVDGNLGVAAALAECLVQSHAGVVELLPAVPDALGTGTATGLVARPGLLVDLEWADGELVRAALRRREAAAGSSRQRTVTADEPVEVLVRWRERELRCTLPADGLVLTAEAFTAGAAAGARDGGRRAG
ncbi:glycosyl hydrolase family 95 catalytic domain-containing protein [Cellulomonas endophytica]|uniref:glycosyl hydrolase family 95 catalytic domain-containing protein n=1 Tax=Cellulomonas endophytica TaxID=2494735 RepID=UPI0010111494|nr:glycoside hydrolase N-terminal domain-containing protein [Cellulomonas endophytica]